MSYKKNNHKRFFIIDGYALLFRAHFALIRNPLITSYGLHTSALFGFANQVLKLIRSENPDYIACAFDSKEKTFRHEIYKEYKANRPEMPIELQEQLPHLWEMLESMNLPVLKKPGVEADDIIGTLAIQAEKEDLKTYIVSNDKDFMQLINNKISLFAPGTRKSPNPVIYNPKKVEEKWGVPPEKIIDLLALMGDSSDNVPGVTGVGEKTAVKLIKEYGSLEGALENVDKVTNKRVHTGLKEGVKNAKLSKELVTILTNVELASSVMDLFSRDMNIEAISKKFSELEFHALIKQFVNNSKKETFQRQEELKKDYKTILSSNELNQLVKDLSNSELISMDLETTSVQPLLADIVGLSFSIKADSGWYVPIEYLEKEQSIFGDDDLNIVLGKLKPIFENNSIKKAGQNIKYDALILKRYGIDLNGIKFDTMIAAHLLNPSARSYKLDTLSLEYLNHEMIPIEELIGKGKNQITMDQVPMEKASKYAIEDADIVFQLTHLFNSKLKEQELFEYFSNIEIPLLPVLMEMELNGTYVDAKFLKSMSNRLKEKLELLINDIKQLATIDFNINSTQQLANVLFDILELPQIKKRSTAEHVLNKLKKFHDLPKLILEYRKFNKLKNTYVDVLPELINKETGRIHSTFNQTIAATGRLSSANPNFQNIPIRKEEGREIRKAFTAQRKGWKILSADYSQIELRVMAHISKDKALIDAFCNGDDIHSRTASHVFDVAIEDVLPEMRRTAKVVNFGIMYGAGPFRMSQELGISRQEAVTIIESYFKQYSGIRDYIDSILEKVRNDKLVETLKGRKRQVWDADSNNAIRRQAAERMAINMPIQGTAAEMIKLAMCSIQNELENQKLESKMVLQIHDELLFEIPTSEEEIMIKLVVDKMVNAMELSVPVEVDYGVGTSWFEAH